MISMMGMIGCFRRVHAALLASVMPPGADPQSELADDVARLLNLSCLAIPVILMFVAEFALYGIWQLALALGLAGVAMVASPWIYKKTGSLSIARESFLVSLFAFKLFESVVVGSVASPGSIWFIGMPTIAILFGNLVSGACWLGVSTGSMLALHHLYARHPVTADVVQRHFDALYTFSLVFLALSMATYVFMVDASRKKAYRRLQDANELIRELAIRDPLTGVFNRRYIWERMAQEEQRVQAGSGVFHVCLIDLDRFKQINDTLGHAVGDAVLKTVARSIQGQIREEDCFARYGGEEFILLLHGSASFDPEAFAQRIRRQVADLCFADVGGPGQVTVSIGIAQSRQGERFSNTIKRSDRALYAAKAGGRNRVVSAEMAAPVADASVG
jgi:diguanylate cyclase (GGDEF)-like protein